MAKLRTTESLNEFIERRKALFLKRAEKNKELSTLKQNDRQREYRRKRKQKALALEREKNKALFKAAEAVSRISFIEVGTKEDIHALRELFGKQKQKSGTVNWEKLKQFCQNQK